MAQTSSKADLLISSMLQPPKPRSDVATESSVITQPEMPTMLEIMMKEQAEAKRQKENEKEVTVKKEQKTFGGGFKKGFFGQSNQQNTISTITKKKTTDTLVNIGTSSTPTVGTTPDSSSNKSGIPVIKMNKSGEQASLVLNEVHEAMKDSTHPMLNKLQQGEWMTPDLLEQFKANDIISAGMANPKCVTAMQLLQTNPAAAKMKFEHDPEVSIFLAEFGRVMAAHFEKLGGSGSSSSGVSGSTNAPPSGSKIAEIGPLQAEALSRAKKIEKTKGPTTVNVGGSTSMQDADDKRVQEVLADDELRTMLLDPELQRVIQECNNPALLRKHMQDPVTAYKIKKLCNSGLLGIAS